MGTPFYSEKNFRPQTSIGYLIRRIHKLGLARMEASFDHMDVSFIQWAALSLIHHGIADTASGLARDTGHDSGAMTRVIDQLEARGLLKRSRDTADRRVVKLDLTAGGEALVARLSPSIASIWNEVLDGIDPAEIETFISLLSNITARLEALESDCGEKNDAA